MTQEEVTRCCWLRAHVFGRSPPSTLHLSYSRGLQHPTQGTMETIHPHLQKVLGHPVHLKGTQHPLCCVTYFPHTHKNTIGECVPMYKCSPCRLQPNTVSCTLACIWPQRLRQSPWRCRCCNQAPGPLGRPKPRAQSTPNRGVMYSSRIVTDVSCSTDQQY